MTTGSDRNRSLGLGQHASVLGCLRYGDWEMHRLHQTAPNQTVALFEMRLAALEKCTGLLQDTVPMGEFSELAQTNTQQDDQSYNVSFPKLDKRETVPAASHLAQSRR